MKSDASARPPDDCAFEEPSPAAVWAYAELRTRPVLASRARAEMMIILGAIASYTVAKFWFEPSTGFAWYGPMAALAACQLFALARVRSAMTTAELERIVLVNSAVACTVTAWAGVAAGRTTGADFLLLGLAMLSAALVPWRPRMQAILVVMVTVAIAANAYGVTGAFFVTIGFPTLVPVAVVLVASVYTSVALEGARFDRARSDLLRERAEAEARELNATLERRVAERTAELVAANAEMEAFSYSVSHDMRAPLRAMDGLSEAMLEDFDASLEEGAKNYLQRIRSEARRLGQLVDDLLKLSRVTRAMLQRKDVDLSALALRIVEVLRHARLEPPPEFRVMPGLQEQCDETLVRLLLENLLDNAVKFSSTKPAPCVEFGAESANGSRVYFVRDNGVGFDMAYESHLFHPFERLHRADEFEGTGIGLATVERIVRRHGGTIRAHAEPGKGATFRFTLNPPGEPNRE